MYATPRVPGEFIARPQLAGRLGVDVPLVVVRGAAGSGKTVLAAQWARGAGPGAWITVDNESSKRLVFWRYVIDTLEDAGLIPTDSALAASSSSLDSVTDLRRFLVRGFVALPQEFILVVDDYQRLTEHEVDDDIVALLQSGAPVRAVVLTRQLGGLESERVRVALAPEIVSPRDMPFSEAEIAEVAARAGVRDPGGVVSRTLKKSLGGLPIAVRGAIVALQRGDAGDVDGSLDRGIEHVVQRMQRDATYAFAPDSDEMAFAESTSVADTFTVGLARALSGRDDARQILLRAEALGVGLWSHSPVGDVFSYTPVIRSALRAQLEQNRPDDVSALCRVASVWAFEHEQWAAALRYAIEAGDLELASRTLLQDWLMLVNFYGPGINELLGAYPLESLREYPVLAIALALYDNQTGRNQRRMGRLFAMAVSAVHRLGPQSSPPRRALLLAMEGSALRLAGRFEEALEPSERMLELVEGLEASERAELQRVLPTMLAQTGITYFSTGFHDRGLEILEAAYEASEGVSPAGRLHAFSLAAGIHAWAGHLRESEELIVEAQQNQWPEGWSESYIGALYHLACGFLAVEEGAFSTAQEHVDALDAHLATFEYWWLFLYVQSLIDLAEDRALSRSVALGEYLVPGARPAISEHATARLRGMRAILLATTGRLEEARRALDGTRLDVPAAATALVRVLLAAGDAKAALEALEPILDNPGTARQTAEVVMLKAAVELRLGREPEAVESFLRGLVTMRENLLVTSFTLLQPQDRAALAAAARRARLGRDDERYLEHLLAAPPLWPEADQSVALTEREQVVLGELHRTGSASEIAETLFVSTNTVKSQLRSLYRKLGVRSREDALLIAREQGLLD